MQRCCNIKIKYNDVAKNILPLENSTDICDRNAFKAADQYIFMIKVREGRYRESRDRVLILIVEIYNKHAKNRTISRHE